jgi:hypothetical protein
VEELGSIAHDIVRRLAERAAQAQEGAGTERPAMVVSHDRIYHSKY